MKKLFDEWPMLLLILLFIVAPATVIIFTIIDDPDGFVKGLYGLVGYIGFLAIIFFFEQRRLNKPIQGRGLPFEAEKYHRSLSSLLSPYASTSFAKELLEKAYDSIKGDYEAYKNGARSEYLSALFDDEYQNTQREECWAICFILECINLPSGNTEEANAAHSFLDRQKTRIISMYEYAKEHNTPFPFQLVECSKRFKEVLWLHNLEK